ncbi:UreF-domain-containing protein [Hysterangium stoloniferum]|nr:UreF-domain-containing protein [Hysterangium stoloniferum]
MADDESYLLLLLSDGNLPTGSFVASSGLESYVKHGFLRSKSTEGVMDFIRSSVESYAHTALPFVTQAHKAVSEANFEGTRCRDRVLHLDSLYDVMTLNHVARRASRAQGVALLTLFSKGFSRPSWLAVEDAPESRVSEFIDDLKLQVRLEATPGHLPICWGAMTAALNLSLDRSLYLHLFLHARGLLSAAIRMNVIGPYAAQQLLLHAIKPLVEGCVKHGYLPIPEKGDIAQVEGPTNTWPLGEILATRHDLQHSRVFNS